MFMLALLMSSTRNSSIVGWVRAATQHIRKTTGNVTTIYDWDGGAHKDQHVGAISAA
jgi:hypothetical protein